MSEAKFMEAYCTSRKYLEKILEGGYSGVIIEAIASIDVKQEQSRSDKTESHTDDRNWLYPGSKMLGTRRTVMISTSKGAKFDALRADLVKAREECDVVVLSGDNEAILRRILDGNDRHLIDAVQINLHSVSMFKPAIVRLLNKANIFMELPITQLLKEPNRATCLANARHIVRTFVRHSKNATNLVLSMGAGSHLELRSVEEMKFIAAILGLKERDAQYSLSTSVQRLLETAYHRRMNYLLAKSMPAESLKARASEKQSTSTGGSKRAKLASEAEERRHHARLWNIL